MHEKNIDQRGYDFTLKERDGDYYLIVPMPISIGVDVIHKFSESEMEAYNERGTESLDDRIEMMKKNPKDYDMRYWR
jgi:hypothetical protein